MANSNSIQIAPILCPDNIVVLFGTTNTQSDISGFRRISHPTADHSKVYGVYNLTTSRFVYCSYELEPFIQRFLHPIIFTSVLHRTFSETPEVTFRGYQQNPHNTKFLGWVIELSTEPGIYPFSYGFWGV